jgi:heme o synthase
MRPIVLDRATAFYELTKPGITRLVLVTTAAGFYLASRGSIDLPLLLHMMLGTALAASGTNALNQWVERDADAQMRRTANRPLPSGRLTSMQAVLFAWGISIAGLAYLTAFVNVTTAAIVALSLSSYVFVYTPLKKKTWWSTVIGAVPGALPILAGWTATGQPVSWAAIALFGIMFAWQMPHFYALAWIYREDYGRAGFQMLTVVDSTGDVYLIGAVLLGAAFLFMALGMLRKPNERLAWRLFTGSIVYLPVLLLLMVVDKVG